MEQRNKIIRYEVTASLSHGIICKRDYYKRRRCTGLYETKIKFKIIFVKQRRTTTNARWNSFIFITL